MWLSTSRIALLGSLMLGACLLEGCSKITMEFRLSFLTGSNEVTAMPTIESEKIYALLGKVNFPASYSQDDSNNETRSRCITASTSSGRLSAPSATQLPGACLSSGASCTLSIVPNQDIYVTLHYMLPAKDSGMMPIDRDIIELQLFDSTCPPQSIGGSAKRITLFISLGQPPKAVEDFPWDGGTK